MQVLRYHRYLLSRIADLRLIASPLPHMESLRQPRERRQRRLAEPSSLRQTQRLAGRFAPHANASEGREGLHIGDRQRAPRRRRVARPEAASRGLRRGVARVQRALHGVLRRGAQSLQQNARVARVAHRALREGRPHGGRVVGAEQRARRGEIHAHQRGVVEAAHGEHFHGGL